MEQLEDSSANKKVTAEESAEEDLLGDVLAGSEDASRSTARHGEFGRKFMDELTGGNDGEYAEEYLDDEVELIGRQIEMEEQNIAGAGEFYEEGDFEVAEEEDRVIEYDSEVQLVDSDEGEQQESDYISDDKLSTKKSDDARSQKHPGTSKSSATSKKPIDAMLVQRKRHLPVVSKLNPAIPTKPVEIDHEFVLPGAGDIRSKIQLAVTPFTPHEPTCRPSLDLPLPGIELKGAILNPYIELYTTSPHEYAISGKVSGAIFFTPESTWPEETARVCLFYYFWNSNSGEWARTEFVTVKTQQGKETRIRFVLTVDPKIYSEQKDGVPNLMKSLLYTEKVSITAVVGAEGVLQRSNESCIDFGQTWNLTDHSKKLRLATGPSVAARSMGTQTEGKCKCPFPSEQED
ncbi:hypothetical protein PENTCL1PPCAC_29136 [Pristionchus entomophagus]|uniref:Uncharacterized protein n=1 Tax=Pristionchus entomophagus TaxID=358040 RepID=A0AAV5UK28_9BILA|nr:hypothetical protein PENTCL1PPCAC_29136 [Pristionchus entomophagus]